ncbi:molybdopterin-dependent oxidoreductase [Arcobacter sp.]|uniref:molybdopterin-dependent oxidoreductase n=1 Tax=unclassified Arcobacter TaxID=2593671 RepID=UPI003B007584
MKLTACPMDCFDACEVVYKNGICKPNDDYITNKKLCKNFAYLIQEKNIIDKDLNTTLKKVVAKLKEPNQKVLYYKGSGNMGVMQKIPMVFFEKISATFASGSICDAGGEAGIEMGRKYNVNPSIKDLQSSEVILVWGRNLTQTSAHIYKLIKDKIFITIDPVKTPIAKKSEVFLQIPPKGDYLLAKLLQKALNDENIDINDLIKLNITQEQFNQTVKLLTSKKVSVMLGVGAQKYKEGAAIFHEIDKVCDKLNLFDKKNRGVWYLANSAYPFDNKISINPTKTCSYADVKFDDYDVVFIQGANPVISAPNAKYIVESLKNSFVIFMGTTANETSKYADIIIPAKTFLQKKDVRLSYGHDEVTFCEVCEENDYAISEYELTSYLFKEFGFEGILSEDEYLNCFKTKINDKPDIKFIEQDTKNVELLDLKDDEYYLLTSKNTDTINSQFKYDEYAYVHPIRGFIDNQLVTISSKIDSIQIKVKNDERIYSNSILIYAGNKQVNRLTSNELSFCGTNATFQDIKLTII